MRTAIENLIGGLFVVSMCFLQGCINEENELQHSFTKELLKHKTDDVRSIDLRTTFGTNWTKVCIQHPYMFKADFERTVGKAVDDFKPIADDRYVIWVFYANDRPPTQIEIETARVMEYQGSGSRCTSFQQPYLYFDMNGGKKKYFFNDAGESK